VLPTPYVHSSSYVPSCRYSPTYVRVCVGVGVQQREWRHVPLAQRIEVCTRFMEVFNNNKLSIASDISWQMGKPLSQSTGEVAGTLQRLRAMIAMAPEALADDQLPPLSNGAILRSIKKEPIGVALVLAPWNYPLLTAANAVFPAILAGNAVVLKHSERTPSAATAFVSAFEEAGLPKHLMSSVLCTNDVTAQAIRNPRVGYVAFTGSVQGGRSVHKVRFIHPSVRLGLSSGSESISTCVRVCRACRIASSTSAWSSEARMVRTWRLMPISRLRSRRWLMVLSTMLVNHAVALVCLAALSLSLSLSLSLAFAG